MFGKTRLNKISWGLKFIFRKKWLQHNSNQIYNDINFIRRHIAKKKAYFHINIREQLILFHNTGR